MHAERKLMASQQYRSEQLERTLRGLHVAVPGIKASVVVNVEGLLVAAYPPGNEDNPHENPTSSPQVAAMAATLIGLAETTLNRLDQGDLKRLMIDADNGTMVIYPANRASLAVLVEKGTKLGKVLYAVSQVRDEVMEILKIKD
jgi:predicted regulator of Ras-like GTPase activity (Roadblock/LC7/MglB family)